jgi:hypothetical protein
MARISGKKGGGVGFRTEMGSKASRVGALALMAIALAVVGLSTACDKGEGDEQDETRLEERRSRTTEAAIHLGRLATRAEAYYRTEHMLPNGGLLPAQFPVSAPRSPNDIPCGQMHTPDAEDWENPTWQELDFDMIDPHWYSYQFDAEGYGPGARFTVSAFGDLDCDQDYSTFVRIGTVTATGRVDVSEITAYNEVE